MAIQTKHAFKPGESVTVFNRSMSGRLIIEGKAIVRRLLPADHRYMVEFVGCGDEGAFERRVEPGPSQTNPLAYLAECIAIEDTVPTDRSRVSE